MSKQLPDRFETLKSLLFMASVPVLSGLWVAVFLASCTSGHQPPPSTSGGAGSASGGSAPANTSASDGSGPANTSASGGSGAASSGENGPNRSSAGSTGGSGSHLVEGGATITSGASTAVGGASGGTAKGGSGAAGVTSTKTSTSIRDAAVADSRGDTPNGGEGIRQRRITTRGFAFDALESGSAGEPVLLLHGFPDTSLEWSELMPVLSANGYHCLAPDQRGYSPGARPATVDAYRYEELVADAFAFGRELGTRFHVIGHDWGAVVGWLMLQKDPSPIVSFTAIAIPHYGVWARSVYDDKEMAGYLSMLNTWMTEGKGEAFWTAEQMRTMWKAKPADQREATIAHMLEPGTMTAALNWYRASRGHKRVIDEFDLWEVNVPTLLIWGSKDVGKRSVADTAPLMKGDYLLVQPDGAHFIIDEQPKAVAEATLAQLRAHPMR